MTKSGAPFSARDRRRMVRFLLAGCKDSRARGELVAETPPRELQPKLADSNSANDIEGKGDKNSFCLENGIYIVRVLKENVNPLRTDESIRTITYFCSISLKIEASRIDSYKRIIKRGMIYCRMEY